MKLPNKVLVTGASGLIGMAVCESLEYYGIEFTAVTLTRDVNFAHGTNVKLDILKPQSLATLLALEPDYVIHCAAIIPGSSKLLDMEIYEMNYQMDRHIFELCQKIGSRLVYISSTSIYGFPLLKEVTEEDTSDVHLDWYSKGKLLAEQKIMELGIDAKILRINAPYGSNQSTNTVLKIFIERALKGQDIVYYGSGGRQQDFTNVRDISSLIINTLDIHVKGTFNISANTPISMRELGKLVIKIVNYNKNAIYSAGIEDPQEHHKALYDTSLARSVLGWQPRISLEEGLKIWIKSIENEAGSAF